MVTSRSGTDPLARLRAWWLRRQGLTQTTAPKTIEACVRQAGWLPTSGTSPRSGRIRTLEELEREHIVAVLEVTGWRVSGARGAATLLGMKPTTLEARMRKLGIRRQ